MPKPNRRAVGPALSIFKGTSLEFIDGGPYGIIEQLRTGLDPSVMGVICGKLDLSIDQLLCELKLRGSTAKNRQAHGKRLPDLTAERLVRTARTFKRALEVFENESDARAWLRQPLRTLGGASPLSFLDTGPGYELVEDELKRIQYGVVA